MSHEWHKSLEVRTEFGFGFEARAWVSVNGKSKATNLSAERNFREIICIIFVLCSVNIRIVGYEF